MGNTAKVGYIYILTNEAFHQKDWIKIGYTKKRGTANKRFIQHFCSLWFSTLRTIWDSWVTRDGKKR